MNPYTFIQRLLLLISTIGALVCCKKDTEIIDYKDYPNAVGKIIRSRCANIGCHNDASHQAAGGLNMSTWNDLFKGTRSGASIIPYRADYSPLIYFVNTYTDIGPVNTPLMPLNGTALSREEVNILRDWINAGAPDREGVVKFADNPYRRKFYVAHSACRVAAVFDAESQLAMRYVNLTQADEQCTPHALKVSPDNKYWYVCYNNNGRYLRRYRTADDTYAGQLFIGAGEWNSFAISPDSKKAFVIDWSSKSKIAVCDLENMVVTDTTQYADYPHGSAVSPDGTYLYATATKGNYLYKINILTAQVDYIGLSPSEIPGLPSNLYNPHEVAFSPDGSKYYVTCETEKTVRVFDAANDAFITSISLDGSALEMTFSVSKKLLLVSSWDSHHFAGTLEAIAIIDITNNSLLTYVNAGTQPHGLAADDVRNLVYVANRNLDSSGPTPHHSSICGGRNGYISYIDLNTLQMLTKRSEVSADPYSVAIRP